MRVLPALAPSLWLSLDPLILASRSPARLALLKAARIPVEVRVSALDEGELQRRLEAAGENAQQMACSLARAKTLDVSERSPQRLVLGADQSLSLDGKTLHKPADADELEQRLRSFSGQTHVLHSAVALARDHRILCEFTDRALLTCRPLTDDFIARYIALAGEHALASVGGYEIEGLGLHLFERAEGQYSTVLGLPMLQVLARLREMGQLAG